LKRVHAAIRSAVPPETTETINSDLQVQRVAAGIGRVFEPLQFVPHESASDCCVQEELKDYQTSKGAIRFPVDKPLPAAPLKKLVKARIVENEQKNHR
jgi:hypothetical protein